MSFCFWGSVWICGEWLGGASGFENGLLGSFKASSPDSCWGSRGSCAWASTVVVFSLTPLKVT